MTDIGCILAIDPGSERSAWLWFDTATGPTDFGISPNEDVLAALRGEGGPDQLAEPFDDVTGDDPDKPGLTVVIEKIESYGMTVGAEIFATVHWSGRFTEAARSVPVVQLPRRAVKLAICGDTRAKDANIRQALIDRFGGTPAIRKGGSLYGISKDVWSALAIAVTYAEGGES